MTAISTIGPSSNAASTPPPAPTSDAGRLMLEWCRSSGVSQQELSRWLGYSDGWVNSVVTGRVRLIDHARLRAIERLTGLPFQDLASDQNLTAGDRLRLGLHLDAVVSAIETATATADDAPLTEARRTELLREIRRVCEWLGKEPSDIPADPRWLLDHLSGLNAVRLGVSARVMQKCRSALNVGFRLARAIVPPPRSIRCLGRAWRDLYDAARAAHPSVNGQRHALVSRIIPMIRWCDADGLAPAMVDDAALHRYASLRARIDLRQRSPSTIYRRLRNAWNNLAATVPGWPVPLGGRRSTGPVPVLRLPLDSFPESFQAELAKYVRCRGLRDADRYSITAVGRSERHRQGWVGEPVYHQARNGRLVRLSQADDIGNLDKPLAPGTAAQHADILRLAASAMVRRGLATPEAIRSIADVATLPAAVAMLEEYDARHGQDKLTSSRGKMAASLYSAGLRWCGIPNGDRLTFQGLITKVSHKRGEMSAEDREVVATVGLNSDLAARLIRLPSEVFGELEARRRRGESLQVRDALRAEAAVQLMLLATLPVRRNTLMQTTIPNLLLPVERNRSGWVYWDGETVKGNRPLQADLPPWKVTLLRLFIAEYRPLLTGRDGGGHWLFPARHQGHKGKTRSAQRVGLNVQRLVGDELGIEVRSHLWRKIWAGLLFNETKNAAVADALLGHSRGSRATEVYVDGLYSRAAAAELDTMMERLTAGREASR